MPRKRRVVAKAMPTRRQDAACGPHTHVLCKLWPAGTSWFSQVAQTKTTCWSDTCRRTVPGIRPSGRGRRSLRAPTNDGQVCGASKGSPGPNIGKHVAIDPRTRTCNCVKFRLNYRYLQAAAGWGRRRCNMARGSHDAADNARADQDHACMHFSVAASCRTLSNTPSRPRRQATLTNNQSSNVDVYVLTNGL